MFLIVNKIRSTKLETRNNFQKIKIIMFKTNFTYSLKYFVKF